MIAEKKNQIIVLGAGPAGLTAAYELTRHNLHPIVFEKSNIVGGLSRTDTYKGYSFDMGGHRFFTKIQQVQHIWEFILGEDFLCRPRLSRIYYNDRFFMYPLKPFNALGNLGIMESTLAIFSFIQAQIFPIKPEVTFEQWVTNRFGNRLYQTFFKTYTEKVWGIPCSELNAEWAAQRIKDLSLKTAVISMFFKPKKTIKTLIEEFHYPRQGPGMFWQRMSEFVQNLGGNVCLESEVVKFNLDKKRISSVVIRGQKGEQVVSGEHFISSIPISEFIKRLDPVPEGLYQAAQNLHYRDFLTVCLIVDKRELFPDNWIYVHSPEVKVGRIQNFKNWSSDMVPDPSKTSLGLEYFCTEGDEIWNMPDEGLINLGKKEIERIGLAKSDEVIDGCVFRVQKAYPIYDSNYYGYLDQIKEFVNGLENFQSIGRNGLHRYNNQDHSMMTGIVAVRNLVRGERNDLWSVNADQEYHELIQEGDAQDVESVLRKKLPELFPRLDPLAYGLSLGLTSGLFLFLATVYVVFTGSVGAAEAMALLAQFFPTYTISVLGAIQGFAYLFLVGFSLGWLSAYLRNVAIFLNAFQRHKHFEMKVLRQYLDYF